MRLGICVDGLTTRLRSPSPLLDVGQSSLCISRSLWDTTPIGGAFVRDGMHRYHPIPIAPIQRALQICSRVIIDTPGFTVFFRSVVSLTAFHGSATGIRPLRQEHTGYQPYERFSSNYEPFVYFPSTVFSMVPI
jgi:hypothetical protein